jgi:hypothetical protein
VSEIAIYQELNQPFDGFRVADHSSGNPEFSALRYLTEIFFPTVENQAIRVRTAIPGLKP